MQKTLTFILIIAVMAGLIGLKTYRDGHNLKRVNVAVATNGVLADSVLASGNFVFNKQIKIRPEVSGRVAKIFVTEGDAVEQGQLLMQLDDRAFLAEVEQVEAQIQNLRFSVQRLRETYKNVQRQLTRHETLLAKGLVQQESVDELKSHLEIEKLNVQSALAQQTQSEASLKFVNDQLHKTQFFAPMDGIITSLDIKEGETVIAGTTNIIGSDLMTLADPSVILAELRVDEADIANVSHGLKVEVYAATYPTHTFTGTVTQIGTSAKRLGQNAGLAFSVKVRMDKADFHLYPGMSCRAEIITHTGDTTTNIPIAAVQYDNDQSFIWKVRKDKAMKQMVQLGMATDTQQAILKGLDAGEHIIVGPARTLSTLTQDEDVNWQEVGG